MKPGLNKHINRLRRGIAGLLRNHIFDRFSEDRCGEIDNRSQKDSFVRGKPKVILNYLKRAGIDHSTNLESAFDVYNEIVVFDHLRTKCNIVPLPEADTSSDSTLFLAHCKAHKTPAQSQPCKEPKNAKAKPTYN